MDFEWRGGVREVMYMKLLALQEVFSNSRMEWKSSEVF